MPGQIQGDDPILAAQSLDPGFKRMQRCCRAMNQQHSGMPSIAIIPVMNSTRITEVQELRRWAAVARINDITGYIALV